MSRATYIIARRGGDEVFGPRAVDAGSSVKVRLTGAWTTQRFFRIVRWPDGHVQVDEVSVAPSVETLPGVTTGATRSEFRFAIPLGPTEPVQGEAGGLTIHAPSVDLAEAVADDSLIPPDPSTPYDVDAQAFLDNPEAWRFVQSGQVVDGEGNFMDDAEIVAAAPIPQAHMVLFEASKDRGQPDADPSARSVPWGLVAAGGVAIALMLAGG